MRPKCSGSPPSDDGWAINFKSVQARRDVIESMRLNEDKHLRGTDKYLPDIKETTYLAEWVSEAIARGTTVANAV